ncbi:hypothetical protein BLNAU_16520 [Blattamonas nauphoetae]|uniref:Ubiquitin-like domain-containing protein n=1 Tax=Blattamonas nauphoetae TaxID=2049346 RepID=A0ABQ9XCE9_9EUKA|nr:hypothetical protein BLNAU_16520 [Blattamonas nauphoetae]
MNRLEITVKTTLNETTSLSVSKSLLVSDLKKSLSTVFPIPSDEMILIFRGKSLNNDETLSTNGISNRDILSLVRKPSFSPPPFFEVPSHSPVITPRTPPAPRLTAHPINLSGHSLMRKQRENEISLLKRILKRRPEHRHALSNRQHVRDLSDLLSSPATSNYLKRHSDIFIRNTEMNFHMNLRLNEHFRTVMREYVSAGETWQSEEGMFGEDGESEDDSEEERERERLIERQLDGLANHTPRRPPRTRQWDHSLFSFEPLLLDSDKGEKRMRLEPQEEDKNEPEEETLQQLRSLVIEQHSPPPENTLDKQRKNYRELLESHPLHTIQPSESFINPWIAGPMDSDSDSHFEDLITHIFEAIFDNHHHTDQPSPHVPLVLSQPKTSWDSTKGPWSLFQLEPSDIPQADIRQEGHRLFSPEPDHQIRWTTDLDQSGDHEDDHERQEVLDWLRGMESGSDSDSETQNTKKKQEPDKREDD